MVKAKSPGVVLRGILYLSKRQAFLTEGGWQPTVVSERQCFAGLVNK